MATPATTLDDTLGFEFVRRAEGDVVARIQVSDRVKQKLGAVHGGVYSALAESLASRATCRALTDDEARVLAVWTETDCYISVTEGSIEAEARCVHRGHTTWSWEVKMMDELGQLCARSRVRIKAEPLSA